MGDSSYIKQVPKYFWQILKPFKLITKISSIFIIWFSSVIFISHVGVLAVFIAYNSQYSFIDILSQVLQQGILYGISIVLCASYLSIIFVDMIITNKKKDQIPFMSYKLTAVTITIADIIVISLLYMSTFMEYANINEVLNSTLDIDIIQILVHIFSIMLVIYLFCLSNLNLEYDEFKDLDDQGTSESDKLKEKSETVNDDGKGISL